MLRLKNIVKNYTAGNTNVEALKGINLEFRKSEFVSILGQSGCGKTTLLNIIGGLDRYTSGDLIINNKSTKDFTDSDWDTYRNQSIGFVFQSYNLIPHLPVLGNVELALTLSGVSSEERRRRAIEALEKVGLNDQIYKKPNQLSGGQMQRVAIARALVNNPDILLADEPTGALDSETSVQIMEILKEISQDRLIIMVTHNPELANSYSTRIIRLLDGRIIGDSNPFQTEEIVNDFKGKKVKAVKKTEHTSMSFLTALSLSLRNLGTKKARTFLTAFAGSIGIIGIALVLALSNGFQTYVDKMQADTLSSFPLTISETSMDFASMSELNMESKLEEYPILEKIYINKIMNKLESVIIKNNLSEEYINHAIKTIDPKLINGISYTRDVKLNIFKASQFGEQTINQQITTSFDNNSSGIDMSMGMNNIWQELIDNPTFINSQYDVLKGHLPTNKNEIVIVVDKYNQITDLMLMSLGIYNPQKDVDDYLFEDIIGLEYKLILNNDLYTFAGNQFIPNYLSMNNMNFISDDVYNKGETLKIVGILRANSETNTGSITGAIAYSKDLTDYLLASSNQSDIVKWQKDNPTKDPISGSEYIDGEQTVEDQYKASLAKLGGITTPSTINIYPIDFDSKQKIKEHLDLYNDTVENEEDKVYYTDIMDMMVKSINTTINAISYVLIAFTSISLVVSSIMIGIITYISVLERTKEIGVLRSIGARKKDISRVFNAETLIIGFVAGLIGVLVTMLLSIPINIILNNLVNIKSIASLNPIHSVVLVIISMTLTLIAGLIPSRIAAKKDPVVALRTE